MNIALIFAGGTGQRMNSRSKPKQFLEIYGKPIIIHTIEHFEFHQSIDKIVVVCIKPWIEELNMLLRRYGIEKVCSVIPGGSTGQESIHLGLEEIDKFAGENDIVLIHDGVRPLINEELITTNIDAVIRHGSAISSEYVRESIIVSNDRESVDDMPPRDKLCVAKAPQSFYFKEIFELYNKAREEQFASIDSAHLCHHYHKKLHIVESTKNNIKVTEPGDYYVYRALYEALESQQLYGI